MRPSRAGRALAPGDDCLKTSFGLEVSIFSFFLNDLKCKSHIVVHKRRLYSLAVSSQ